MPAVGIDLKVDGQGEVLARGNHILKSYWDQPEATADALEGGWFHTGDGGTLDDGGYLTISDRKKDVIISGGENVSSIEVEDCLFSHTAVAEVCVIGVPDEKWGETIKALVVLAPGTTRHRGRAAGLVQGAPGRLQVPDVDRVPRRAGPHRHRQAPEVQAPGPVLGRPRAPGQLTACTTRYEPRRPFPMADTHHLSQAAYDRLKAEHDELTTVGRVDIARKIEAARELGDLKENGDYHAAKDHQGQMEARIRQLGGMIENAEIVEGTDGDVVEPGCVVELRYEGDDDTDLYFFGSVEERGVEHDIISPGSPLGEALVGRKPGDKVDFTSPTGANLTVELVSIQ